MFVMYPNITRVCEKSNLLDNSDNRKVIQRNPEDLVIIRKEQANEEL
jgi:hypothetical protein